MGDRYVSIHCPKCGTWKKDQHGTRIERSLGPWETHVCPVCAREIDAQIAASKQRGEDLVPWTCHAKPAATGKTCGHVNTQGMRSPMGLCCELCGCTKIASDARAASQPPKEKP